MELSCTCAKLYSKCINRSKTDITYKSYIKYRNIYNQPKKKATQTYDTQIFNDLKHDIRKTWKIINSTIGKLNDKTATLQTFKIDNTNNISDSSIITDNLCDFVPTLVLHMLIIYFHLSKVRTTILIFRKQETLILYFYHRQI